MSKQFEGRAVTPQTGGDRLYVRSTPQFIYMHHPNQWDLLATADGYELLPKLTKFQILPGLNGVKMRPGGGVDYALAKSNYKEVGWLFVENDAIEGGYLREFDGVGGRVYQDRWTTPRRLGSGARSRVIWDIDLDGYNAFRRGLVDSGVIPNPDPAALDFKIALLEKRSSRKLKNSHVPKVAKEIAEVEEKIAAVKEVKKTKKTTTKKKAPKKKPAADV